MDNITIGQYTIGPGAAPFIIAEMSGNHGQSIEKAKALIDAAANAGAHAVKLQTYTPDTITLDVHENEFFINDPNSLWEGNSLYNLYREAMTPWEWHAELFQYAEQQGLLAFSTPFDLSAVAFLETLNPTGVPLHCLTLKQHCPIMLLRNLDPPRCGDSYGIWP